MKQCEQDVCEDHDRDSEWRFLIYYYTDVRKRQLSFCDSVIKDNEIRYLDHLPSAVYEAEYNVIVFMWNRIYYFNYNREVFNETGMNTIPASYQQIEQYFKCQWCSDQLGLIDFVPVDLINFEYFYFILVFILVSVS